MKFSKNSKLKLVLLLFLLNVVLSRPIWAGDNYGSLLEGYVSDRAGLLQPEEKRELASLLADFEQKTTNQFVVVTLPSLPPGESLELFSLQLAEASKAGRSGQDNGLLLLIVSDERKVRVEVGTGLEEKITDGRAGRVIREVIAPAFQEEKYFSGIKKAVMTLVNWTDPSYFPAGSEGAKLRDQNEPGFLFFLVLFFVLIIVSTYYSRIEQRRFYKRGYSQRTMGPVFYPISRSSGHRSSGSFKGFSGGGFRGGGGGFRGGGASGGW
ncbi:MAG TPA: hypothetical protein DEB05_01345 [Firmicutes bacterium]|jgi:uncharacterized protein|nr:hypothetical protein [Bacillota bacterium]